MFTKQIKEIQALRSLDVSTPDGWATAIDRLACTIGNCLQELEHRGQVNINVDGLRDGAADWPLNECANPPDDGRDIRDVYAALTASNPASVYNEDTGFIENGLAAKFIGVVCIGGDNPSLVTENVYTTNIDVDNLTINESITVNNEVTITGTGADCPSGAVTLMTGLSVSISQGNILFTYSRVRLTFHHIGCTTVEQLGDVFQSIDICDVCDGGTGGQCDDIGTDNFTATLTFTNCDGECQDGSLTLNYVSGSGVASDFIDPETDEEVAVTEYWEDDTDEDDFCGVAIFLFFYCVPKPEFPNCQQMVMHIGVDGGQESYVVRSTSCDGSTWVFDVSDFDCFGAGGPGTLQVTIE